VIAIECVFSVHDDCHLFAGRNDRVVMELVFLHRCAPAPMTSTPPGLRRASPAFEEKFVAAASGASAAAPGLSPSVRRRMDGRARSSSDSSLRRPSAELMAAVLTTAVVSQSGTLTEEAEDGGGEPQATAARITAVREPPVTG
jgi:hypothetical protein